MHRNILFLTLRVFSATGGIEKVCRIAGKALYEYGLEYNKTVKVFSMHDSNEAASVNEYFPSEIFYGYGVNKIKFVKEAIEQGCKSKLVVLSHINLLIAGWFIKKLSPSTNVVMFAHGIEIWYRLPAWKRKMLKSLDLILPVSRFTTEKIIESQGIDRNKCIILNNCLDPFLAKPRFANKSENLLKQYSFTSEDTILLTLTRLSSTESYKGYDKILMALHTLSAHINNIKYLLVGKYDDREKKRIDAIVKKLQIETKVCFAGFINDEDVADHFNLADVYVMPSEKEGFGIVFIEAMYYGKPVIAGNIDGSADALCDGALGILVDPHNQEEITAAIKNVIQNKKSFIPGRELLMNKFGYTVYKNNLKKIINSTLSCMLYVVILESLLFTFNPTGIIAE